MFTKTMDKKIQGKSSSIMKQIPYRFYEVDEDYIKLNLHLPSSEIEYNPNTELFDDSGDMFVRELNDRMPDIKKDMAQITEAALQTWKKLSIRTKEVFLNELLHCYDHNDGFEFHEIIDRMHSFFIVGVKHHIISSGMHNTMSSFLPEKEHMFISDESAYTIRSQEELTDFLSRYLLVRDLEREGIKYDFGTAARAFQIRVDKGERIERTLCRSPRILEMITGPKRYSSTSEEVQGLNSELELYYE